MLFHVTHRTRYIYAFPVSESHNEVRLQPLSDESQTCHDFRLAVAPTTTVREYAEPGGIVHFFNLRDAHTRLEITAEADVETVLRGAEVSWAGGGWSFYDSGDLRQDYAEYLGPTKIVPLVPEAVEMAAGIGSDLYVPAFLDALNRKLGETLTYLKGVTHVHTTLEEFARTRCGVCQDFAHFLLAACRSRGIPCRYVSGYLYTDDDPESVPGPGATHAWVECLLPDGSWRGYDPTNPDKASDHYIRVHHGRDYSDVVPVKGIYRGAQAEEMCVEVWVSRSCNVVRAVPFGA